MTTMNATTTKTTMNALTVRRKMQLQIIANKAKAKAQQQKLKQEEEEWDDLLGYLAAAILAVGLTLSCPGHTDLWSTTLTVSTTATSTYSESSTTLNWWILSRALISYTVTIVVYFRLQGSDPGYLTANMLNDLGDGYNARGEAIVITEDENVNEANVDHNMPAEGMGMSASSSSVLPNAMTRRFRRTVPAGAAISDDDQNASTEETTVPPVVVDPPIQQPYHSTRRPLCPKCKFAPPIRAHHCKQCNRCVATFDHHCDFVGTCIGEQNRCLFWWFLLAQAVSFILSLAMVESSSIHCTDWYYTGFSWTVLNVCLVKLYLYPLTIAAVAMLLVHTVWALGNTTTFEWSRSKHLEYLQGRHGRFSRFRSPMLDWPFSRGIIQNLSYFCLGPSRNDDDNIGDNVAGGDSSSASRSHKTTRAWKPTIWQPPRRGGSK
jgi:hypothetical protein